MDSGLDAEISIGAAHEVGTIMMLLEGGVRFGRLGELNADPNGYLSSTRLGGKVPSRVVVDVTAGYRLPKQQITISGTLANMFDNRVPDVLGAPLPHRLMWLQVTYDFDGLRY